MAGTGDGLTFSPKKSFSRAMFVAVLASLDYADTRSYTGSHFPDVKTSVWYAKAVELAYQNGYTQGNSDGRFAPNEAVTRETLAVFFYNYVQKKGWTIEETPANLSAYPDGKQVSSWARDAMAWAVSAGIIGGVKEGETVWLKPKKTASRAEVAQIVMSFWFYVNA